ncbi:desulfoferrodoxin family protein, partial [Megasphaera massiliensis]|uniref:desulfoferrodoxin family protein n=1 Tax=Megasphaera massiliensis TaxID=1232428 RepID=UPI00210C65E7
GSVIHPMEEKHYNERIALVDDKGVDNRYLKPAEEPKAHFETGDNGEDYAYCNLHGLWKETFSVKEAPALHRA